MPLSSSHYYAFSKFRNQLNFIQFIGSVGSFEYRCRCTGISWFSYWCGLLLEQLWECPILECYGIDAIVELSLHINNISTSFARTLSWAYSNMCFFNNHPFIPQGELRKLIKGVHLLINYDVISSTKRSQMDKLTHTTFLFLRFGISKRLERSEMWIFGTYPLASLVARTILLHFSKPYAMGWTNSSSLE